MRKSDKTDLPARLSAILGPLGYLSAPDDCARYVRGARYGEGQTLAVLRPDSHEQLQQVVAWCAAHGQALVLQGANTGLVAASTPDASGRYLVLSLERLRRHIVVDPVNRSVEVDAGVTLQDLNAALEPHGLFFPIDLGANPSIGGMIAANTGGARLIKYGDVRQNLLGLRAVLMEPAGAVLDLMTALRKNNTGPDLKQILVGSSGAYGVITRAVLQVHCIPRQSATALVVPRDQAAVLQLLQVLERDCGEFLSAFEGISGAALQAVLQHIPAIANPFAAEGLPDYCVLLELDSSAARERSGLDLEQLLTRTLEDLFGEVIDNAVLGRGQDLWRIRHAISEALRHQGKLIAFDISMPRSALVEFRSEALTLMAARYPWLRVMDFGHWADGGCHFNLVWPHSAEPPYQAGLAEEIRTALYDLVVLRHRGSFSAEHGIGPYNLAYYQRYTAPSSRRLAGRLQNLLDPQRLLGLTWFGEA
ncbi:MAG: FAD-binding oxidoreductase [Burkholderiales bacterium]|nr:FAD-binding oxidoreductase [Burkholderiales bacterium]